MNHTVPFQFESRFKFRTVEKDQKGLRTWRYIGYPGNIIADEVEARRIQRMASEVPFIAVSVGTFNPDQIEVSFIETEAGIYTGPDAPPEPVKVKVVVDPSAKEKKKKEPKQPKVKAPVSENEITIEQLAQELKTTPQKLRSKLRKNGHQKSGPRWSWEIGSEEVGKIKSYFK